MTYCVATMIDEGIVFASDSRTNAGVDNVATFCKMRVFECPGERVIVVVNSGNLAITQATLSKIDEAIRSGVTPNLLSVPSLYDVADLIGRALRDVRHRDGPFLAQNYVDSGANFIIGGQIKGEEQRLFLVYSEGNFIEATMDTPYFQIGEVKYGKPVIDRVVSGDISLKDAIKCVLVSFDSTMRSNLTVGMPIDLACTRRAGLSLALRRRFDEHDAYMLNLRQAWNEGIRRAFAHLPEIDWRSDNALPVVRPPVAMQGSAMQGSPVSLT